MTPDLQPKATPPAAGAPAKPHGHHRSAQGKAAGAQGPIDFWLFLRALRRRWLLATLLGVFIAGSVTAAVWFLLPPGDHVAVSQLHIRAVRPDVIGGAMQIARDPDFHTYKTTQAVLARSRIVLNAALRSPKLANNPVLKRQDDPLEWLERNVRVGFGASVEIMHISLGGHSDDIPAIKAIVDEVTLAYISEIVNKDKLELESRQRQITEIATRYGNRVKQLRMSMRKMREALGTGDKKSAQLRQRMAVEELKKATDELLAHRSALRIMKTQLAQFESGQAEVLAVSEAEIDAAVDRELIVANVREDLAAMKQAYDLDAAKAVNPNIEPLRVRRDAIKEKEKELNRKKGEVRSGVEAFLKNTKQRNAKLAVASLKRQIKLSEEMEKILEKDRQRLHDISIDVTGKVLDIEDWTPELDEALSMFSKLSNRAELMLVESEAPSRITRMQEEAIVQKPDEVARKMRFSGIAGAAALGLVVFGVGMLEYRTRRLGSAKDVTVHVGLNVIGSLPFCRGKKARNTTAQQQLKEAVDSARTLLLHASQGDGIKVVQVASSVSGEGKTSLACHLASSLARAGRRTLLIDADLRKPNVHGVFGVEQSPGLSELLRGEVPSAQAVQQTRLPGLDVLAAGLLDERALSAVAQTGLSTLLGQLRHQYDFVIVDSSPVLPVPDALMIGQHVDAVLFAVMEDVTRMHHLQAAVERMMRVGAQVMGVVVNGSREADHQTYGQYARYIKAGQS